MDAALSIADSALSADTAALAVTAENVANAQTAGYVDQSVDLQATAGDNSGVGTGVAVTTVAQAQNALLTVNNLQAQGALQSLTAGAQVLSGIENVFPLGQNSASSSTASSNTSLAGQLANFWSAWDSVAQDPSALASRTQVVDMSQGLVTTLHEASTQLSQLAQNTSSELQNGVSQLNTLLNEAATLNGQIVNVEGAAGNPAQLQDQMNNVVGQLAQLAGVNVTNQPDGTSLITAGGVALVQGTESVQLQTDSSGGQTTLSTTAGVPVAVSSGSVAGLLSGLNQYIPAYSSELDGVANTLSSLVNGQLAAGYTATGASGSGYPLFEGSGAAGISVNQALVNDPSLIAAASTNGPAGANDGSNAQAMAELALSTTGPDAQYQTLIQNIGAASQAANAQVSSQTAVANQAETALQSVTGVNTDTELTHMMTYQQAYEASAKLLSTIDQTMQSLLAAV